MDAQNTEMTMRNTSKESKAGHVDGKRKLKNLLKDINELALDRFEKVYMKDEEFRNTCYCDQDSYGHIKDFILALAEEIKLQYGPVACSAGHKRMSMKRARRYFSLM